MELCGGAGCPRSSRSRRSPASGRGGVESPRPKIARSSPGDWWRCGIAIPAIVFRSAASSSRCPETAFEVVQHPGELPSTRRSAIRDSNRSSVRAEILERIGRRTGQCSMSIRTALREFSIATDKSPGERAPGESTAGIDPLVWRTPRIAAVVRDCSGSPCRNRSTRHRRTG